MITAATSWLEHIGGVLGLLFIAIILTAVVTALLLLAKLVYTLAKHWREHQ